MNCYNVIYLCNTSVVKPLKFDFHSRSKLADFVLLEDHADITIRSAHQRH